MSISERLRQARQEKGDTQEAVARAINVALRTYQTWESGKAEPKVMLMRKVAAYYGKPMEWFCN